MDNLRNLAEVNFRTEQKMDSSLQLDPRILSSIVVSLKVSEAQDRQPSQGIDPQQELLKLTHSAPMLALLSAAENFSQTAGVSPQDALKQILVTLGSIDGLWSQVLMKEGLARLSSQYH